MRSVGLQTFPMLSWMVLGFIKLKTAMNIHTIDTCNIHEFQSKFVEEYGPAQVLWQGVPLSEGCHMRFITKSESKKDEFKMCFKANQYHIKDSKFKIKFWTTLDRASKVFNQSSDIIDIKGCFEQTRYLNMKIISTDVNKTDSFVDIEIDIHSGQSKGNEKEVQVMQIFIAASSAMVPVLCCLCICLYKFCKMDSRLKVEENDVEDVTVYNTACAGNPDVTTNHERDYKHKILQNAMSA